MGSLMDKNKKPGIKIDSIILAEISFKRSPKIPDSPTFDFRIDTKSLISDDKKTLQETVSVAVESSPDKSISASCVMVGQFTCECDETNMTLDEFSKANAPAIIYPFCREALASVSVQSGMPPIILPVVNFQLIANRSKETTENNK
ncbi:MAG TPA: protein-export chaperone SecB [Rectinema sp.]|jgi:preprotein translocase subunit SecB|nr:protein-export chaperone SecB [Rectinema sp.]